MADEELEGKLTYEVNVEVSGAQESASQIDELTGKLKLLQDIRKKAEAATKPLQAAIPGLKGTDLQRAVKDLESAQKAMLTAAGAANEVLEQLDALKSGYTSAAAGAKALEAAAKSASKEVKALSEVTSKMPEFKPPKTEKAPRAGGRGRQSAPISELPELAASGALRVNASGDPVPPDPREAAKAKAYRQRLIREAQERAAERDDQGALSAAISARPRERQQRSQANLQRGPKMFVQKTVSSDPSSPDHFMQAARRSA